MHSAVLYNVLVEEVYYQAPNQSRIWSAFQADRVPPLSTEAWETFTGKTVLITGAGGFIGSALAETLATLPLTRLVLLDQAEHGLFFLSEKLRTMNSAPELTFVIGSVLNRVLLQELFSEHKPAIVFHAAARKHVPLMQSNPFAAAETNVLGTEALVEAVEASDAERFVLLSTDKAVNPVSVMGASKRIAEQIVLAARDRNPRMFAVARLCNVLGSTGSVGPLFVEAIAAGKPLSLTHADATRYFLTITDAVRFLQQVAVSRASTGIFVPQPGPPRRIHELATFLLKQSPFGKHSSSIVEIGLRPGEKLHEQLIADSEVLRSNGEVMLVDSDFARPALSKALESIRAAVETRHLGRLELAFQQALPDFVMNSSASITTVETAA